MPHGASLDYEKFAVVFNASDAMGIRIDALHKRRTPGPWSPRHRPWAAGTSRVDVVGVLRELVESGRVLELQRELARVAPLMHYSLGDQSAFGQLRRVMELLARPSTPGAVSVTGHRSASS